MKIWSVALLLLVTKLSAQELDSPVALVEYNFWGGGKSSFAGVLSDTVFHTKCFASAPAEYDKSGKMPEKKWAELSKFFVAASEGQSDKGTFTAILVLKSGTKVSKNLKVDENQQAFFKLIDELK